MDKSFLIVNNTNGNITTEKTYTEAGISITQFSGTNTDNFILRKQNGKHIEFSFFKLNGIYYVNFNGYHIVDYRKFVKIQQITKDGNNVIIKIFDMQEIQLSNCDVELVHKAIKLMAEWMKGRSSFLSELLYILFQ